MGKLIRASLVALSIVLATAFPANAGADSQVITVCRIEWIHINGTCHADLVAVDDEAGQWLAWLGAPLVLHYTGTFEWSVSWGDDPNSWFRLVCGGAGATSDCVSAHGSGGSIEIGDSITFDASANAIVGDVGVALYGVAYRDVAPPSGSTTPTMAQVLKGLFG